MTDALVEAVARAAAKQSYAIRHSNMPDDYIATKADTNWDFWKDDVTFHLQAIEAAGYRVVPVEATEGQWDGLARQIIMWMDMHPKTPRALFAHLKNTGHKVPQWLRDEPEMKHLDHVPSKGTRAVIIYRAMLSAAPRVGEG